ncbi:methyltransferase type 11 [Sorangium cellulosum]|uniref:Methyltransferase type 11 n=1 Tax=Sorangium cellulosum TaxID=56 RepID=A0A2L0F939_SORCE|nr:class I SAM-dependent methyltransferase [Sorangium cellulosum]AUX47969.1 methyltransferase type 11 [Sorangium cellulosum]
MPENIVGNHYDKYGTKNPVARLLMGGFLGAVTDLYRKVAPRSVLEVGCGEGRLAHHLATHAPRAERFVATDVSLERAATDVDPLIQFREASVYALPFEDREFDLIVCCEVLEHLEDPARALRELRRVAGRWVIVSTPREPLWRALNMMRGRYLADLGNTPGHIQHFRRRDLVALVGGELAVREVRNPVPWTVLLAEQQ